MANSLKDRMSQREAALRINNQKQKEVQVQESVTFASDSDFDAQNKKTSKTPSIQLQQLKKALEKKKESFSGLEFHPFRQNKKPGLKESMKKIRELKQAKKDSDKQRSIEERTSLLKEAKADNFSNKKSLVKDAEQLQIELKEKQEERYEKELSARTFEKTNRLTSHGNNIKWLKRGVAIFLIVLSAYMLFLTFGVLNTDYVYNENNEVVPKRVTFGEINELKSFQSLATQYYACRSVYEEVLLLDYRYSNAESHEELVLIASEYWKVTDKMKNIGVAINALKLPSEYTNVKNQLLTWTSEYMYWYCQRMSYSITDNSVEDYNEAVELQKNVYGGFKIISTNLASLGLAVSGAEVDVENISSWSPEKYIDEQTGGLY